jgi:hypothetical protein
MFEREDFLVGMVLTSLYQSAATVDAPIKCRNGDICYAVL